MWFRRMAILRWWRVAYGSTAPCKGQHTYVHETLHNLYVGHEWALIDVCGWDVGLHLQPDMWDPNVSIEQRKLLHFSRIMGHNSTENSWAASEEYKEAMAYGTDVLRYFTENLPNCPEGFVPGQDYPCIEQKIYIFSGRFPEDPDFDAAIHFPYASWETYQNPWIVLPMPYTIGDPTRLPYRLVFRAGGESSSAEVPFDARMATNPDDGSEGVFDRGFFNIAVPESIVQGADEMIRGEGIDEIPFRNRTEPPVIESLRIQDSDGEGRLSVTFLVEDVDTEMLACQFSFSLRPWAKLVCPRANLWTRTEKIWNGYGCIRQSNAMRISESRSCKRRHCQKGSPSLADF